MLEEFTDHHFLFSVEKISRRCDKSCTTRIDLDGVRHAIDLASGSKYCVTILI
ncbi:hypothetical protein Plhal304r1_c066g0154041 [Plasmopara halstedii]